MALRPCKECGHQVSSDAKFCPHCGKKVGEKARMKKVIKQLGILIGCFLGIGVIGPSRVSVPLLAQTTAKADKPEVFDAIALLKNPYKWRGHTGILGATANANGWPMPVAPVFVRMLDEHTALYELIDIYFGQNLGNNLLVVLPNSDPPGPSQGYCTFWRVQVIGPASGSNALALRFPVQRSGFLDSIQARNVWHL